jgi:precorrin isomerase
MNEHQIIWDLPGSEIEAESFRRIEAEVSPEQRARFTGAEWRVARRLIHTTADFSICEVLEFGGDPIGELRSALSRGTAIYSDSNMIKAGLSVPKLQKFHPGYRRESILCEIASPEVAALAAQENITRALAAVRLYRDQIENGIFLCGNAPLALAGILRMKLRPAVVIAMPVGFVNVVESKMMLDGTGLPFIRLNGRRGGSPLAVAAVHSVMEE